MASLTLLTWFYGYFAAQMCALQYIRSSSQMVWTNVVARTATSLRSLSSAPAAIYWSSQLTSMLAPVWLFSQSVFELELFRFLSFHLKLTQQEVDILHVSDKRMVWNNHIRSTISIKMINLWFVTSKLKHKFPQDFTCFFIFYSFRP